MEPGAPLLANRLSRAALGDLSVCLDHGIALSTGSHGAACDLIEAHEWFNLAALHGDEEPSHCRSEVAEDMSARDIAEAQRRARQWLSASSRKAA